MQAGDIIAYLKDRYPLNQAMDWDNSGLQAGRETYPVEKIMVALDATNEVLDECIREKIDLLVTHHPLLFAPVKQVTPDNLNGSKVLKLIENKMAQLAMHTNFDVTDMRILAEQKLGLVDTEILEISGQDENGADIGIGSVGYFENEETISAGQCCERVKNAFDLDHVRLFGDPQKMVRRIAISPGSGKSMVAEAQKMKADILITGDIGHHDGLDAVDEELLIIDAGHYGIEKIFVPYVADLLRKKFPEIQVLEAEQRVPFYTI